MAFDARLLTILFAAALTALGHRSFKTLLNPVSALVAPLGLALLAEAILLPKSPFGVRAAAVLVSASSAYAAGALIGRRPAEPVGLRFEVNRNTLSPRMLLVVAGVCAMLVVLGARQARSIYDSAGVGFVQNGVFDRSRVIDALGGTGDELVIRVIQAFVFPACILICFFWLSKQQFRVPIAATYVIGVLLLSLALRARLIAVLAVLLATAVLLLASGRRRIVRRAIPIVILGPLVLFFLFSRVSDARYGNDPNRRDTQEDFIYATVGGPAGLAIALSNEQPVVLLGGTGEHVRGQSISGLLSLVGRSRVLGTFSPVYVSESEASQINLYTGAWILMWDVGFIGMLVVMGLLGLAARAAFRRLFTRPTPGALLATANLMFLMFCYPIALISYYNLWWGTWLLIPILNRMFRIRLDQPGAKATSELLAID